MLRLAHSVTRTAATVAACVLVAGCGKQDTGDRSKVVEPVEDTAGEAPRRERSDPRAPETPVTPDDGRTPARGPAARFDASAQRIVAGTSCAGHGEQITDAPSAGEFTRAGNVWSRSEFWGCGCPRGPEFTLVYEPGTSPLLIRLCHDETRDPCEAGCRQTLSWDLGPALTEANASDVAFAAR